MLSLFIILCLFSASHSECLLYVIHIQAANNFAYDTKQVIEIDWEKLITDFHNLIMHSMYICNKSFTWDIWWWKFPVYEVIGYVYITILDIIKYNNSSVNIDILSSLIGWNTIWHRCRRNRGCGIIMLGSSRGRHDFRRVSARWPWGHGGHWTVVFNGMYFGAEYSFFQYFMPRCSGTTRRASNASPRWQRCDSWVLIWVWGIGLLLLTSRYGGHSRGRGGQWRLLLRLLVTEFSALSMTVFVTTRSSFTLRIDFPASWKKSENVGI